MDDINILSNFIFTGLHGYEITPGLSTNKQRHHLLLLRTGIHAPPTHLYSQTGSCISKLCARKAFATREKLVDLDNAGCSLNEVNRILTTLLYEQTNSRFTTEPSMNLCIWALAYLRRRRSMNTICM